MSAGDAVSRRRRAVGEAARSAGPCVGFAAIWFVLVLAARVLDGGQRLGVVLLLLAGFVVGWLSALVATAPGSADRTLLDGRRRPESRAARRFGGPGQG